MSSKYRIAVLGLTHDHVWSNLEQLNELENAELVAAADPNQPLLDKVEDTYGAKIYQSHEDLLESEKIQGETFTFSTCLELKTLREDSLIFNYV